GSLVSLAGAGDSVVNSLLQGADYAGSDASAVTVTGAGDRVLHSTVLGATGHGVIVTAGSTGAHLAYLDVSGWALAQSDVGGVYVCCAGDGVGTVIDHSWVHDSAIAPALAAAPYYAGAGL